MIESSIDTVSNPAVRAAYTGARVSLTAASSDDARAVNLWKNDEELQLLSSDTFVPESLEATQARLGRWIASDPNEIIHFAIRLREEGMVGFCRLAQIDRDNQACKIGIVLGERRLWGRGLGAEAVSLLVASAFEQQLTRVGAEVYANNARSIRMLERVGFEREGMLKRSVRRAGVTARRVGNGRATRRRGARHSPSRRLFDRKGSHSRDSPQLGAVGSPRRNKPASLTWLPLRRLSLEARQSHVTRTSSISPLCCAL